MEGGLREVFPPPPSQALTVVWTPLEWGDGLKVSLSSNRDEIRAPAACTSESHCLSGPQTGQPAVLHSELLEVTMSEEKGARTA